VKYYFRAHKLALHPNKTKFLIFSHANFTNIPLVVDIDFNNFSRTFNDDLVSPIEFINPSPNHTLKFLGVLFDPTLNFKAHVSSISPK
jgi:hypothetical protein